MMFSVAILCKPLRAEIRERARWTRLGDPRALFCQNFLKLLTDDLRNDREVVMAEASFSP